jgi:2-polyprenyl-3-methyl-5-hydroxy-6-metoxy-1,4-benzoquinol methylase
MEQPMNLYNEAYRKFTPDFLEKLNAKKYFFETNESLINFYKSYSEQFDFSPSNVLDCGCGIGGMSYFFRSLGLEVKGVDISEVAISIANTFDEFKRLPVDFKVADLGEKIELNKSYDLIFDSHLLHCITNSDQRGQYYRNVQSHMHKNSHFLIETMVFDRGIDFPIDYYFDESSNLNQKIKESYHPVRKLLSPKEVEEELLANGFKINYLYYHNELSFNPFVGYPELKHQELPKTLRIGLKLN